MKKSSIKPLATSIGATLLIGAVAPVMADSNPFTANMLDRGYELVNAEEGKCGEGKCGEGKCGEGKCGESKSDGE